MRKAIAGVTALALATALTGPWARPLGATPSRPQAPPAGEPPPPCPTSRPTPSTTSRSSTPAATRPTATPTRALFDDRRQYLYPELPHAGVTLPAVGVRVRVVSVEGTTMRIGLGQAAA